MREDLVFKHYSKVLDKMFDDPLFTFVLQSPREFYNDFSNENYSKMPKNLSILFGASRLCIIDDNYPFVIKVDYTDMENRFEDFSSFCERELYFFNEAQERNLDRYLTEVKYLGEYRRRLKTYRLSDFYNYYDECEYDEFCFEDFFIALNQMENEGIQQVELEVILPLYGYEKAYQINFQDALTPAETQYYRSFNSSLNEVNVSIIAKFIKDYGLEEYYDFNEFLQEFNISDIHRGNVGDINGKIVILDYAGYPKNDSGRYNVSDYILRKTREM